MVTSRLGRSGNLAICGLANLVISVTGVPPSVPARAKGARTGPNNPRKSPWPEVYTMSRLRQIISSITHRVAATILTRLNQQVKQSSGIELRRGMR